MEALKQKAKELLQKGDVKAVLGYAVGTGNVRRPHFARTPEQVDRLVLDEKCTQNLATYLTKHEVKHLGKVAVVALPATQRALLQLVAERQLRDDAICLLAMDGTEVKVLPSGAAVEQHLALKTDAMPTADKAMIEKLMAMTREQRWAYWQQELSRCVKCYACRNSCPMCYCEHCTMDCNRPQWVPVASHALGNLEYHMVRAMHLAGRCVECGECGRACPVGIPVHLLTFFAEESTAKQFGQRAGHSTKLDYALSTFKPDDKETFIR
ncbi:MAG: 4Fe-4S dicluster domain-containing protein [Holophaga sp.]|nr:4Fe-4S dicluster domain-containing protein [Holophaga sp.]